MLSSPAHLQYYHVRLETVNNGCIILQSSGIILHASGMQ